MRRISFAILCAALVSQVAVARQLSSEEALNAAIAEYSLKAPKAQVRTLSSATSGSDLPTLAYTVEVDAEPAVYVFTQKKGGYMVVAANDAVPTGLLGYTDNGEFNPDSLPGNVAWVLDQYGKQVSYAASMEQVEEDESGLSRYDQSKNRRRVDPLVKTTWGQTSPYNAYTPEVDGSRCPTGCVATAMAQVMYTYRYPSVGTGSKSVRAGGVKYSVDLSAMPFDWDAMASAGGRATTTESADAIANLMYAIGMGVTTTYKPTASSSNYTYAARCLVNNFGYDNSVAVLDRSYFESEDWADLLYGELAEGRPVMYSGASSVDGGHAFICDGYDGDNYFHINWGWDGAYNGYFLLSALDPRGNNAGFVYNESMIIGIRPAQAGTPVRPVITYISDFTVENAVYDRTTANTVTFSDPRGIFNKSIGALDVTFGARLVSDNGEEMHVASANKIALLSGQAIRTYTVPVSAFPTEGRWTVYPAFKTTDGEWHDCLVMRTQEYAYVLDASATALEFTTLSESKRNALIDRDGVMVDEFELPAKMTYTYGMEVKAVVNNTSEKDCTKIFTPVLKKDGEIVVTATEQTFDISGNSSVTVDWRSYLKDRVEAGTYQVAIVNRYGKQVSNEATLEVELPMSSIEEIGTDKEIKTTEVYNLNGQYVQSYENDEMPALTPGIYVLRHTMSDGSVETEKVAIR